MSSDAAARVRKSIRGTEMDLNEICQLELFQGVSPESVHGLLQRCPRQTLAQGEILIRAGSPNRQMYIVLAGFLSVHLDDPSSDAFAELGRGETVGEISAIDQQPASASVRAVCDASLLVVDLPTLWSLIGASHAFAVNLILELTGRVRGGNRAMSEIARLRSQFEKAALYDALTGVANRRWLDQSLPRLVERHDRAGEPFALAMIDIDNFKPFNDDHGHQSGDRVLTGVARTLADHLRPTDLLSRIGGEEFVAIFSNTDAKGATIAAERLRSAVAALQVDSTDERPLPAVTISIGLADATAGQSAAQLLEAADAALYRAKEKGRNRTCR